MIAETLGVTYFSASLYLFLVPSRLIGKHPCSVLICVTFLSALMVLTLLLPYTT